MKILGMTIHDRTPEIIRAVFGSLRFPGNRPDYVAVCYDRAPRESVRALRDECTALRLPLRECFLDDDAQGFRCPSLAWNAVFNLIGEDHAFCISSDCVLGPHSIDMAYHLALSLPDCLIVGRAEHSGPSYGSVFAWGPRGDRVGVTTRVLTSAIHGNPIGFAWLLPLKRVRRIGGYDMAYMDGLCYEDNDFVARLWADGADIVFCDDILALHIEHTREHTKEAEKIAKNEALFVSRYGGTNFLDKLVENGAFRWVSEFNQSPGVGVICHEKDATLINQLLLAQQTYGNAEPWRAIPRNVRIKNETKSDIP